VLKIPPSGIGSCSLLEITFSVCQLFQLSNEFMKCDDRKQVLKIPALGIGSCSLVTE
jgi:hypothetical protein